MNQELRQKIQGMEEEVITWRRQLHKYPELSFKEYRTTGYIKEALAGLSGIQVSHPTETSTIVDLDTGRPGRNIAIRADIDALPIQEENDLDFRSVHDGVMHACGHDGHTAALLGVAHILANNTEYFDGKIKLIFQHAEEQPPGGAIELYEAGVMEGVDELYGFHLSSAFPTGVFGIRAGVLTAATDEFRIKVIGQGGHSAFPQLCVDPVVIGAQVITAIQTIVSRKLAASDEAVISTCMVNAGTAYNIIPDSIDLTGSIRSFSEEVREKIRGELDRISSGIAAANGGRTEYEYLYGYSSVVNAPELAAVSEEVVSSLFGPQAVMQIDKVYPGEDFSALHKDCIAMFVEVGTGDEAKGTHYPHHNASYIMDEDMLIPSVEYLIGMILSRMKRD